MSGEDIEGALWLRTFERLAQGEYPLDKAASHAARAVMLYRERPAPEDIRPSFTHDGETRKLLASSGSGNWVGVLPIGLSNNVYITVARASDSRKEVRTAIVSLDKLRELVSCKTPPQCASNDKLADADADAPAPCKPSTLPEYGPTQALRSVIAASSGMLLDTIGSGLGYPRDDISDERDTAYKQRLRTVLTAYEDADTNFAADVHTALAVACLPSDMPADAAIRTLAHRLAVLRDDMRKLQDEVR